MTIVPQARFTTIGASGELSGDAPESVDVALLSSDLLHLARGKNEIQMAIGRVLSAPSLAWVQTVSTGVEHPVFGMLLARGVRLTNAPGIHGKPIAEYVFAHLLALTKRVREHAVLQARREYTPLGGDELTNKTIGIVGYGGIGRATARLARAFGMRVLAVRRSPVTDDLVDEMLGPERLDDLLAESHVVVIALPLTEATRGLFDARRLRCMRPDAVLVNVARGQIVEERALVDTLRDERLSAAVLDVHAEEPLPPESPLWQMERAIVTAHDSSHSPLTLERGIDLFLENLRRYVAGDALVGEVEALSALDSRERS